MKRKVATLNSAKICLDDGVHFSKRALRRQRARERRYIISGSGATSYRPIPNPEVDLNGDTQTV